MSVSLKFPPTGLSEAMLIDARDSATLLVALAGADLTASSTITQLYAYVTEQLARLKGQTTTD